MNARVLFAMILIAFSLSAAFAQAPAGTPTVTRDTAVGDLLVAPTRVVLTDDHPSAEITLINVGAARATYRVSFLHERMSETGEMSIIAAGQEHPDEHFADDLVRYTPRQVVLEPRLAQLLRVQMRLPEGTPEGEYRSHLLFRAVPEATAPATPGTETGGNQMDIQLHPIYGVSIPVIVRHGNTSAAVTMSDLSVLPTTAPDRPTLLTVRLNRTGNASAYGNLLVSLAPAGGGNSILLATTGGVAVYAPNPSRVMRLRLVPPEGVKLSGELSVVYQEKPEAGGNILAKGTLTLP